MKTNLGKVNMRKLIPLATMWHMLVLELAWAKLTFATPITNASENFRFETSRIWMAGHILWWNTIGFLIRFHRLATLTGQQTLLYHSHWLTVKQGYSAQNTRQYSSNKLKEIEIRSRVYMFLSKCAVDDTALIGKEHLEYKHIEQC